MSDSGHSEDKNRENAMLSSNSHWPLELCLLWGGVPSGIMLCVKTYHRAFETVTSSCVVMAISCARGGSGWILGSISSQKEQWLPMEVVESPSLEVFKNHGAVALRDVVSGHGGNGLIIGLHDLRGLSNLKDSMIFFDSTILTL